MPTCRSRKSTRIPQLRVQQLHKALSSELATTVGNGQCGVAASLLLRFAAQKTAVAEAALKAGDHETHRRFAESARADVIGARSLVELTFTHDTIARIESATKSDALALAAAEFWQTAPLKRPVVAAAAARRPVDRG